MSSPAGASNSPDLISPNLILSDDQLAKLSKDELINRLKSREKECIRLMRERAQLMKEVNGTLQLHLAEVRGLREVNQALQKDNQELRDLGCFLDDDRLKARKIAKEWQKFGKYTSTVMRQEVTAYQVKLYELEQKQEQLLRENLELKELCLYLDDDREQRNGGQPALRVQPSEKASSSSTLDRQQRVVTTARLPVVVARSDTPTRSGASSRVAENTVESKAYNPDESIGYVGDGDGIDVDVSHASNSSASSFSSNLDSNSSNVEMRQTKK